MAEGLSWAWRTRVRQFTKQSGGTFRIAKRAYVAAQYLREQLEQEDERPLYDVSAADVTRIIEPLGIQ